MKATHLLAIVVASAFWGCQKESEPDAGPATRTQNESSQPPAKSPEPAPEPQVSAGTYASVQNIFSNKCVVCHTGEKAKEKLDLTSYENVMKGSEHGPVVMPGDPENSMIVHAIRGEKGKKRMPLEPAEPLTDAEIATIVEWIKAGAKKT